MTTIAIANHKGGVGKTTSVASIGAILASMGYRVLLVDLDTQANLTRCHIDGFPKRIVYHALKERSELPIVNVGKNLDIVPSGLEMAGIELEISGAIQRESILKRLLASIADKYDYIILDCPPSLGLITINALVASDFLFVPMLPDTMSYYGLGMIDNVCAIVQELNPGIKINGIFFTKYDTRVCLTSAIEEMVREKYGPRVFQTKIRINTKIGESPMFHKNILEYEPDGKSVREYTALIEEMMRIIRKSNNYKIIEL